jgi:membrane-bound lytic murein transglycosylase MltF
MSWGREAVTYVQNIRHYHSILQWQDIPQQLALPPIKADEYFPSELKRVGLKML